MERLEEPVRTGVVLLDAGVLHDIALSLTGDWTPEDEPDATRRDQIVAAARIRIFADRDQYGWHLAATAEARDEATGYANAAWSVGFVQDVATIDGAPPLDDVLALQKIMQEEGIGAASAASLAWAVLFDKAAYVITADPNELRHQREHDLPQRLEVLDPVEAVARLQITGGELPVAGPPAGTKLGDGAHWWVMSHDA